MAENTTAAKAPMLELILRGAMAALEVVAWLVVLVPVPELLVVRVLETVVPKLDVVVGEGVVTGDVDVVPVPVVVEVVEVAPMLKVPVVAKTFPMFPISTASSVYPEPSGTTGSCSVIWPCVGCTLFAMAKALLKEVLMSSRLNVLGSPGADVHVMVIVPPEVGFLGILRVSPATRGATNARRAILLNIFSDSWTRDSEE
jgi:hypothetical protein